MNMLQTRMFALDASWLRMLLSAVVMLAVFEFTSLDIWLEDACFQSGKFVGYGNWWLDVFSHQWVKWAMIVIALLVWLRVIASGFIRRWQIDRRRWVAVGVAMLLAPATVGVLKHFSETHCPWDLLRYGGDAPYVKLLEWSPVNEPGRCFPAGHATTGFALFGFVLLWRGRNRRMANLAWWIAFSAGFVLGWGQQMRGAHFLSHTLWSAWVCWAVCLLLFAALHKPEAEPAEPAIKPAL